MSYFSLNSRSRRVVLTAAPLLSLCLCLGACSARKADAPAVSADPVAQGQTVVFPDPKAGLVGIASQAVQPGQRQVRTFPGRLAWDEDHTVRIFPAVGGRVLSVSTDVGAHVAAGQTLAVLSAGDFGAIQADARKAEADSRLAAQTLARQRELFAAGIVAKRDLEQAEADATRADAEWQRARSRLAQFGDAAGAVDQKYRLTSPLAGQVVERAINPGMEARSDGAGNPLFVVSDPARLWLQLDVNEADIARFAAGAPLVVRAQSLPGEGFPATVSHVADFVDPVARTVKVRAEVPNPDHRLRAEMFVTAELANNAAPGLYVPARAVFLNDSRYYLFVDRGGNRFERRAVTVGPESDGVLPVLSGLQAGEKVVIEGTLYLQQIVQDAENQHAATATH